LNILQDLGDTLYVAQNLKQIGSVYWYLNNFDKTLEYEKKSLKLYQVVNDSVGMCSILNNLGLTYNGRREYQKALEYYLQSKEIAEKLGNNKAIARVCNNMGIFYSDQEMYSDALPYYYTALTINNVVHDKWGIAEVKNNLSVVYTNIGQFKKATFNLFEAQSLAKEINDMNLLMDNYRYFAELYFKTGESNKAFIYHKMFFNLHDTLKTIVQYNIADLQTMYAVEKKNLEIELMESEQALKDQMIRDQKRKLFLIILFLVVTIIFLFFIFMLYIHKIKAYKVLIKKNKKIIKYEKILLSYLTKFKDKKGIIDENIEKDILITIGSDETENSSQWKIGNRCIKKYAKSKITEKHKGRILNDILILMNNETIYKDHDLTLAKVSHLLSVNRSYLSQVINEKLGKSFINFINDYRIKEAQVLLAEDKERIYTIASVAKEVGFNSINVFNRAFKRYTGITPSFFINSIIK